MVAAPKSLHPLIPPKLLMSDILILAAHPNQAHSRITRALMLALQDASVPAVELRDLYALYPDYVVDVDAEQAALRAARLVVWLHPVHWYSMPPLMKLWLDEVFSFGWAYGPNGHALRGKDLWLTSSTGGPEESYRPNGYNRYFFDAFLHPYEQTAALVGMRWLPPLLLHGAHKVSDADLASHAALFVQRLRLWPHWPEIAQMEPMPDCAVPADARPHEAPIASSAKVAFR
jgi:glutathione-regulated potassium-efflux system ancillary protein KefF